MKTQSRAYVCVEPTCSVDRIGPPGAIVCGRCRGDIVDVTGLDRRERASRINLFRIGRANAIGAGMPRTFYENWRRSSVSSPLGR